MDVGSIFGPPANIHFTSILPRKMDVKWMLAGVPKMDVGFRARRKMDCQMDVVFGPPGKWSKMDVGFTPPGNIDV